MNECGTWDIDGEHCSLVAWSFLAYKAVIHDGGAFAGLEWYIYSVEQSVCMLTSYVLLICDSNCFCFIRSDSYVPVVNFVLG